MFCRVTLIKWVTNYVHFMKKPSSEGGQPSSMTSTGSQFPHSGTPTPAQSLHHEEETSFTVGHPSDSSRASSHDSTSITPHPSLESGMPYSDLRSRSEVFHAILLQVEQRFSELLGGHECSETRFFKMTKLVPPYLLVYPR